MFNKFSVKDGLKFKAIKFDGTHDMGVKLCETLKTEVHFTLVYDYDRRCYYLKFLDKSSGYIIKVKENDYLLITPLGDIMALRQNLFESMFDQEFCVENEYIEFDVE